MPCDIGYRNISRITIPAPLPQEFREETAAPEIDRDLLEKIGEKDEEVLEWLSELNIRPLLEEALARAKTKIKNSDLLETSVTASGRLEARGRYRNATEKKRIAEISAALASQFQIEVIAIAAQLFDYEISLKAKGKTLMLEGEREAGSGVHKYMKVEKNADGGTLAFEHFETKKALELELQKFAALTQKLGVKIAVSGTETSGQPITQNATGEDVLRERRKQ